MGEYLLENDWFYFSLAGGVMTIIIMSFVVSLLTNASLDNQGKRKLIINLGLIVGVITSALIIRVCIEETVNSRDDKFVNNVWEALLTKKMVPELKVESISDEYLESRFRISLINGEVYYVPYENVNYKTKRFLLDINAVERTDKKFILLQSSI